MGSSLSSSPKLAAAGGDRATALIHVEAADAALRDLDAPIHVSRAQGLAAELRQAP